MITSKRQQALNMTLPNYAMKQASFPEMYERWLVGLLFQPWVESTLDAVRLSAGGRLLDVACGTGVVARIARKRVGDTGYVVGIDISSDMLAVARAMAPGIDWRQGNADALPLRAYEQFDAIVCQQGLQFFPNRAEAVAQMRRALTKGGRLAVTTWRSDEEMPFIRELRKIAERRLGAIVDQRYSLGDPAALETVLRGAGFDEVQSRTITRTIRFEPEIPFLRLNAMALVGMSAASNAMADEERRRVVEAIVGESEPVLRRYTEKSATTFELSANLVTAEG